MPTIYKMIYNYYTIHPNPTKFLLAIVVTAFGLFFIAAAAVIVLHFKSEYEVHLEKKNICGN